MRLLVVVTHPMTANILMRGQLAFLRQRGWEVAVAAAGGSDLDEVKEREGVEVFPVPIHREIRPGSDLLALRALVKAVHRFAPDVVSAGTPKAGLLGMLAARVTKIPVRIYTVRGLRLETARGAKRHLLRASERLASSSAHRVVCVSESLRRRYLENDLASEKKTLVLGAGSSNGVDVERFRPEIRGSTEVQAMRKSLGIPEGSSVIGFVGRLTRDKGIEDLSRAFFEQILSTHPQAHLVLLGEFEEGDPVPAEARERLTSDPRVLLPGFVPDTSPYYGVMDVLALPSYREGFPNAPLEAAASGVPVVGYRVTGTVDAVEDGVTGTLVAAGDRAALGKALCAYLADPQLRQRHGEAGRRRVEKSFRQELVWEAWLGEYNRLLAEKFPEHNGSAVAVD